MNSKSRTEDAIVDAFRIFDANDDGFITVRGIFLCFEKKHQDKIIKAKLKKKKFHVPAGYTAMAMKAINKC